MDNLNMKAVWLYYCNNNNNASTNKSNTYTNTFPAVYVFSLFQTFECYVIYVRCSDDSRVEFLRILSATVRSLRIPSSHSGYAFTFFSSLKSEQSEDRDDVSFAWCECCLTEDWFFISVHSTSMMFSVFVLLKQWIKQLNCRFKMKNDICKEIHWIINWTYAW